MGSRTQPLSAIEARTRPDTRGTLGVTTDVDTKRIVPVALPATRSTRERSRVLHSVSRAPRRGGRTHEEPTMPFIDMYWKGGQVGARERGHAR